MQTRVLITGSNGFLGQRLVDLLVEDGSYEVFATSKNANKNPDTRGYLYLSADLGLPEEVDQLLHKVKPQYIINAAALTSVEACESTSEACYALNTRLVELLADYAKKTDAYIVQLSTDFVFDGLNGPYKENAAVRPLNEYGKSKLAAETILQQTNVRHSILRTILVYGVPKSKERSNILLWAKKMLSNKQPIKTVNDQWRSPTFVDDLAIACKLAIDLQPQGIFHISGNELLSISEFVYAIADFWGLDKSLIIEISAKDIGHDTNRPQKTGFILDKARQQMGYQPTAIKDSFAIIEKQLQQITL